MKFFIGICLLALTVGSMGYRITRDTATTSEENAALWTDEQEKEAIAFMTQYCKNVSGVEDAVLQIKTGAEKMAECVTKIFDPEEVEKKAKASLMSAKDSKDSKDSSEEVQEFFKEYCPKTDAAIQCVSDFRPLLDYCLDEEDKEAIALVLGVAKRLITFICHNNGERVLQFISDDGMDCVMDNDAALEECVSDSKDKYAKQLEEDLKDEDDDIDFKITKDDCNEYDKNHSCIVDVLKAKCAKKTISELIDALFHAIKEETKCELIQNTV